MTFLNKARLAARNFGVEVTRVNAMTDWRVRLPRLLDLRDLSQVLDVGANDGGFAADLLGAGYAGKVMSFEPIPSAWKILREKATDWEGRWQVAPQMALSDHDGTVTMHEAGNAARSSSLLTMNATHINATPESATVRKHEVAARRLDDVVDALCPTGDIYLKIDVQGAESMVLAGARDALTKRVKGVQLEMSLVPLYDGQMLAPDLHALLEASGFELWDIIPGFRDPRSLRLLQYDGVYLR